MEASVSYSTFMSCYSYVDHVEGRNKAELRKNAKDTVRLNGACHYGGFYGITIKLVIDETGEEIEFCPRNT